MAQRKPKRATALANTIVFSDDAKKTVQCINVTPSYTNKKNHHCMWCTLLLTNPPMGCPTGLKTNFKEKKVYLRDNTEPTKQLEQEPSNDFITYGIFCSVNCIKAYIIDRAHDSRYRHSSRLLVKMYSKLTGVTAPTTIHPAPHFSMLNKYGGDMSETQYKQAFDKIVYTENGKFNMFPMSTIYDEADIL